jgi:hypothetical protein
VTIPIESERLELPAPLCWRIAEPLEVDALGQAAFYGDIDRLGSKEGERDRHIDLPNAALFRDADFLDCSQSTRQSIRCDGIVAALVATPSGRWYGTTTPAAHRGTSFDRR